MRVVRDDLSLCHDCHFAASGTDETIEDQDQAKRVEDGLIALGIHLVTDYDSESGDGVEEPYEIRAHPANRGCHAHPRCPAAPSHVE